MTDELHGHTGISVELFFEGENAECERKPSADQIHAPRPPGPELRANIVDVSNALGEQLARQAQMKTRKVRENRQRRVAAFRLVHKPPLPIGIAGKYSRRFECPWGAACAPGADENPESP